MEKVIQSLEIEDITECYSIIKRLGQGAYGQVLLAQNKTTGEPVAVKLLRKNRTTLRRYFTELSLSTSLSEHPGIITTYPVFISTMDMYAITQELATAGSLHQLIQREVGIPEAAVKRCAVQISGALDYMHGKGLVHGDLKPDNVLLMDRDCYRVKLSDFGLTQYTGSLVSSATCVNPYMFPELCDIKQDKYLIFNPAVDSWAFGVLLFVTLTGCFPWRQAMITDLMYKDYISWQNRPVLTPPPACWQRFTMAALNMLSKLLTQDPTLRYSVLSIVNYLNFAWKMDVKQYDTEEEEEDEEEEEEEDEEDEEEEEELKTGYGEHPTI